MSSKSRSSKRWKSEALAEIPEGSLAAMVRATSPETARRLDARAIKLLSGQPVTQLTQTHFTATMWQGPLPPPEQLIRYNEAAPNAAEIILQMARDQAVHRQKLEAIVIPEQQLQSRRGQLFAFVIGMTGIVGSVILGMCNQSWASGTLATVSMGVLGVAFITGKIAQSRQIKQRESVKLPNPPQPHPPPDGSPRLESPDE